MKKKWLTLGVPFSLAAILLMASGFSAASGTSGYEAYKAALKNNMTVKSGTSDVKVTITDNGTKLLDMNSQFKADMAAEAVQGTLNIDNGEVNHSLAVFGQDEQFIFKSGEDDTYWLMDHSDKDDYNNPHWKNDGEHPPIDGVERLVYALLGNLQHQVKLESKSDGSGLISLNLTEDQIHPAVNALGSLMVKKSGMVKEKKNEHENRPDWVQEFCPLGGDFKVNFPVLTEDIRLVKLEVKAEVTPEQYLSRQTMTAEITGTDEQGKFHTVVVEMDAGMSDLDRTVVESIDLTGKKVQVIEEKAWDRGRFKKD